MPSTYAHYRMGQEVKKVIGDREQRIIGKYPELYNIGLHGPDILFYYRPLRLNAINQVGYSMHDWSGEEFLERAAKVIRKKMNRESSLAYIYGFICHFALDTSCHGYIDEKIKASGISHTEIEVEFDRELMIMDGKDPLRQNLTGHIVPSYENALIIEAFFPGINAKQVQKALQGMIDNNKLLLAPSRVKRFFIKLILRMSGNYKEMHGLLVNYEKNHACSDSTEKLMSLYGNAIELAKDIINEYESYIKNGQPLNDICKYTFASKLREEQKNEND